MKNLGDGILSVIFRCKEFAADLRCISAEVELHVVVLFCSF